MIPQVKKPSAVLGLAVLAGLLLMPTGCSVLKPKTDSTQFFVLRSRPADPKLAPRSGAVREEIRVGPGGLAGYLEATPIAVQAGESRIQYLDTSHWAEPLATGIRRTLGENLAQRLNLSHVALYPDPVTGVSSREVRYQVNRFEGSLDGPVTLDVTWQWFEKPGDTVLASQHSVYVIPPGQPPLDAAAYVDRLSQALGQWADELATALPDGRAPRTGSNPGAAR